VSILYSVELHMHIITSAPFQLKAKGGQIHELHAEIFNAAHRAL
jgi:hypothetical protein